MGINFGYIRVSTKKQTLNKQLEAIKPYLTDEKYLYSDKARGKGMKRDFF